jgi:hypothetical protein
MNTPLRERTPQSDQGSPVAVTPHWTGKLMLLLAGNVARVVPVLNKLLLSAATVGQTALPVTLQGVNTMQEDRPVLGISRISAPSAPPGPALAKVTV